MGNAVGGLRDGMAGFGLHQLGAEEGRADIQSFAKFPRAGAPWACTQSCRHLCAFTEAANGRPGEGLCHSVGGSRVSRLWTQNLRPAERQA